ncbi:MAG: energy-coupling factor ABC transporter ATP-binding protein [Propionibacteriaceae bacterium]|nr:energy-coupling factor ABC transporter ATP-binding protein [Propionibacteriaceae bacterium]
MIKLDGVTVAADTPAGPKTILDAITCQLPEQRVALVGGNGSGKSTFLRLVNGLAAPSAGRVEVDGLDLAANAAEVRRRVGFVFTDPMAQLLMPTPVEDVELSLSRVIRKRSERRAEAWRRLAAWGLESVAETSLYDLSGGERQLAALVTVLAVDPAVIAADEPTTLLDLRNARRLREAFAALSQQVVVATHDLAWAADFERVLVIDAGRIAADGAPGETISFYRRLAGDG